MKALTGRTAKIIFALPFGIFGLLQFMNAEGMAMMVPAWLPGSTIWVYLVAVALLAASGAIIAGKMAKEAALGLAALMLVFILTIWIPGLIGASDEAAMAMNMSGLLKDLGLAGGALILAGNLDSYEKEVT